MHAIEAAAVSYPGHIYPMKPIGAATNLGQYS
jgi:hypothetical protein